MIFLVFVHVFFVFSHDIGFEGGKFLPVLLAFRAFRQAIFCISLSSLICLCRSCFLRCCRTFDGFGFRFISCSLAGFFDASALVSFLSVALLEAGFVDAVDLAAVFLVFFMFVVEVLTGFDFPALLTDFWGAFLAVGLSVSLTVALFGFLEAFCFA